MIRLPHLLRLIRFDICDKLLLVGINMWIFIGYTHIHIFIKIKICKNLFHMVFTNIFTVESVYNKKKKQLNN